MPFLLDVHFSSLDSQGIQCLETFSSKHQNYCAPQFGTTNFHILSSYRLASSLWVSFIFSYSVFFCFGLSSKKEMGGMILFKLIEMKLYRFLPPCIYEHDLYQAWKSAFIILYIWLFCIQHYLIPYVHGNVLKCGISITVSKCFDSGFQHISLEKKLH